MKSRPHRTSKKAYDRAEHLKTPPFAWTWQNVKNRVEKKIKFKKIRISVFFFSKTWTSVTNYMPEKVVTITNSYFWVILPLIRSAIGVEYFLYFVRPYVSSIIYFITVKICLTKTDVLDPMMSRQNSFRYIRNQSTTRKQNILQSDFL